MNQPQSTSRKPEKTGRAPDLFDKLMTLPLLRRLQPFYVRHREGLLYLFFGGVTMVLNWGVVWFLGVLLGWNEHIANGAAWIITVLVAFLTNRVWVFRAGTVGARAYLCQILSFYASRLASLGAEELILLVFVTYLHFALMPVKIVASVVVVILNYFFSKFLVFRKNAASS